MSSQEGLERLRGILSSLERPVVDILRPGVELVGEHPVIEGAPNDAKSWFEWSSGVENSPGSTVGDCCVMPGYYPLSVEESRSYIQAWGPEGLEYFGGAKFLPFVGAPNGDCYAFVWSSDAYSGIAGLLVGEEGEIEFSGLEFVLEWVLECYGEGAFYVDSSGRLAMNPERCDGILARLQQGDTARSDRT
jgi:hypothetical protein